MRSRVTACEQVCLLYCVLIWCACLIEHIPTQSLIKMLQMILSRQIICTPLIRMPERVLYTYLLTYGIHMGKTTGVNAPHRILIASTASLKMSPQLQISCWTPLTPIVILFTSIDTSLHSITRRWSWGVKARMHGIQLLRMVLYSCMADGMSK